MTLDPADNLSLEEMDRQCVFHPQTQLDAHAAGGEPRIVEGAKGVFIQDRRGRWLLDGFAALYCVNIGYGRTEVADAIAEQARKLAYFHTYRGSSNEPMIRLSHRVLRMAPAQMSKIFFGLSGSDANETNAKIVWYYNNVLGRPEKRKIVSRKGAYHGSSVLSGSLTGLTRHHGMFNMPIDGVLHTTCPHHYRGAEPGTSERDFARKCADDLDALVEAEGPETVAAFIGEPIMGTGGIIPPPEGYWQEIQKVLAKHDMLLIADEVVCGFGRMGTGFGSQYYGMEPDLMTVAKGLTSAYVPLSGAIVSEKVFEVLREGTAKTGAFSHGYTYSGHALAAAAALANLDVLEREGLIDNAREVGAYLLERLHETFDDHPMVGEVRGAGLLGAVEFVANRETRASFDPSLQMAQRLSDACLAEGLIARGMPAGDTLGFSPPLCITRDEVDRMLDMARAAVEKVTDALVREGAWKEA